MVQRPRTLAVAALAMLVVALAGCGNNAKAEFYYSQAFSQAERIERDSAKEVRFLRAAARLFASPEQVAASRRFLGVSPAEDGVDAGLAAEYLARAAAIEADPQLYAQTERCAADIVAERFGIERLGRKGPQSECGHCVRSPSCESWRPSAVVGRS